MSGMEEPETGKVIFLDDLKTERMRRTARVARIAMHPSVKTETRGAYPGRELHYARQVHRALLPKGPTPPFLERPLKIIEVNPHNLYPSTGLDRGYLTVNFKHSELTALLGQTPVNSEEAALLRTFYMTTIVAHGALFGHSSSSQQSLIKWWPGEVTVRVSPEVTKAVADTRQYNGIFAWQAASALAIKVVGGKDTPERSFLETQCSQAWVPTKSSHPDVSDSWPVALVGMANPLGVHDLQRALPQSWSFINN